MKKYKFRIVVRFMWQKDLYGDTFTHGTLLGILFDSFNLSRGHQDLQSLIKLALPHRPTKVFYVYFGFLLFYFRLTWDASNGDIVPGNGDIPDSITHLVGLVDNLRRSQLS